MGLSSLAAQVSPSGVLAWLAVGAARATVVLSLALLLGLALRRAAADVRHLLWSLTFAGLLLLPVVSLSTPALRVGVPWPAPGFLAEVPAIEVGRDDGASVGMTPLPTGADGQHDDAADQHGGAADRRSHAAGGEGSPGLAASAARQAVEGVPPRRLVGAGLVGLWLAGVLAALGSLLASLVRAALSLRAAAALEDGAWTTERDRICRRLGIRRAVRLLIGDDVTTPMAAGILRPAVLLPAAARSWSAERRRVVLQHELVHVGRHDVLRTVVMRLGFAPHWFNPLAWLAAHGATVAREQACDELVVDLGIKPSTYADHLLSLAGGVRRSLPIAALPMIQRSHLERRLMRILDPSPRRRGRGLALVTVLSMLAGLLSVAAAQPTSSRPAPMPVESPQGPVVPHPDEAVSVRGLFVSTPGPSPAAVGLGPGGPQATPCWANDFGRLDFSGSMSMRTRNGTSVVEQMIGTRDGRRVIQLRVRDMRLCMLATGDVDLDDSGARILAMGGGARVVLEAETEETRQVLEIRPGEGGFEHAWTVGGEARAFDAAAQRWRDQMLSVLADYWQISRIRGQVSRLRGRISSIRGQESSLRGQISSIRGQRSSLRGQISSIRGQESSLRGRISSIRGHVSALRGRISTERGAISSLRSAARYLNDEEDRRRIEAEIARREEEIGRLEAEIAAYDAAARVAAVEQEIRGLDVEARVAEIEREIAGQDVEGRIAEIEEQIRALDVEGKVAEIEGQIRDLDADRRVGEIEERLEPKIDELERLIEAIGG